MRIAVLARIGRVAAATGIAAAAVGGCGGEGSAARTATFSGGVAAILHDSCSSCHRPGGSAPFALLTYEDAREHARRIASMTSSGAMPPWLPSRPREVFAGERRLSEEDVALLGAWAEAGAPLGEPDAVPAPPTWTEGWRLGPPDLVLTADAPYIVPAGAAEIFRNLVLPVRLDSARWVRAVDLDPGGGGVVHHATLAVDLTSSSRSLDAQDPQAGFDGMGSAGGAEHPGGVFIGWTPGHSGHGASEQEPALWRLRPGSDLVVRLHLRPLDEPVEVAPRIALYFADAPPERLPVAVSLGAHWMDIPAGESAYVVEDSLRLPAAVDVLSVYPHAHYLADTVQAWADTPAGERVWLIEIPEWDFDWQDEYRFLEPVTLPAGSVLRMRFTYDNSAANPRNPSTPPVRVTYGSRSVDEMADLIVQTLPRDRSGSNALRAVADRKVAEIKLGGYRLELAEGRDGAPLRYNMGIAEAAMGRATEAEAAFRAATRLDPRMPEAFVNLGIVLHQQSRVAEAAAAYERALALDPQSASAHHNLSIALDELGRDVEAEAHVQRAVASDSTFAAAHKRLARLQRGRGDLPGASASYRRGIASDPDDAESRMELGSVLAQTGDGVAAIESLRAAIALAPDAPLPMLTLADLLAGYPDVSLRQPAEAVRLASRAVELTRRANPVALFSLANALAAANDFSAAVATAQEASALARQNGNAALARAIDARIERYRRGSP
jgi:tetratricopeptide (TPR) repeat protein/mono/diheme cytochrome c family protein